MLIALMTGILGLSAYALWRIAQRRNGRTAIARWQLALIWIALGVLAISFLLQSFYGGQAPAIMLVAGWCAIAATAVILRTWAWIEQRIARRAELELAIIAAPKPPNEIICTLQAVGTGIAFMLLALPWLFLTNPAVPTSTLIATALIGTGLGAVVVLARILRYRAALRDQQILAAAIQQLRAT